MMSLTACSSRTIYVHDICDTLHVRIENPSSLTRGEREVIGYNNLLRKTRCD